MSDIVRFTVSLEGDLLTSFDKFVEDGHFATRSEAIRQLLRERLTTASWEADAKDVAASLTLVYDHHKSNLLEKMTAIQHDHWNLVVSVLHVHLTHDLCMELLALRGPAKDLQHLAAELTGLKGIFQAQLVVVRAEAENSHGHGSTHKHK